VLAPEHHFFLSSDGSALGPTIADAFGSNTGVPYVASGKYEVIAKVWYRKATAGTVTWTLTSTTNYTNVNGYLLHSPAAGAATNSTSLNTSGFEGTSGATAAALPATASQTDATLQIAYLQWIVEAGTAGNFRIRVTSSAGTVTLQRGSYFYVRRLPSGNTGSFVA
jgi:hypothetical protein